MWDQEPQWLWKLYLLLVQIEAVFRSFKNDLGIRPIYHQKERRVEAHLFVCFQAYCLFVTLQKHLAALAPGLTVRQALDQLAGVQMLEVTLPTTDGRSLVRSRYTQPEPPVQLLLRCLGLRACFEIPRGPVFAERAGGLRWLGPHSPQWGCSGLAALATAKIPCRRTPWNFKTGSELPRTTPAAAEFGPKTGVARHPCAVKT